MTPPRAPHHRRVRYSVRYQACLDAETSAKLEDLARTFHRKRSAILRHVMRWGLTQARGWTVDMAVPGTVRTVGMLLEPELLQQVQEGVAVHGAPMAAWVRHAMREVTIEDFPTSWREGETTGRSHDSGYFHRKFGMRLDAQTSNRLETLTQAFHRSAAEVIRQLVLQARLEDFPPSWQLAAGKHRQENEA